MAVSISIVTILYIIAMIWFMPCYNVSLCFSFVSFFGVNVRGGVEDTMLEAKDTKKNPRPRPRTALPRTDSLEAKDRNTRGQGQGPRTRAQVFFKKKSSKVFFRQTPIHWRTQNF